MRGPDQYVALVSSLPNMERLFFAKQPPLSRLRLDKRLEALTRDHAATLATVENAMSWGAYDMSVRDDDAISRVERALSEIAEPALQAIVQERFDVRIAVAALRCRAQGQTQAAFAASYGRWGRRFAENWSDPAFGMSRRHLWLPAAAALIKERDPKGLERHILDATLRQLQRRSAFHLFDLEAVVIYVLKWSIFDRWARLNVEAAKQRFDQLASAALADFPEFQVNGGADVGLGR